MIVFYMVCIGIVSFTYCMPLLGMDLVSNPLLACSKNEAVFTVPVAEPHFWYDENGTVVTQIYAHPTRYTVPGITSYVITSIQPIVSMDQLRTLFTNNTCVAYAFHTQTQWMKWDISLAYGQRADAIKSIYEKSFEKFFCSSPNYYPPYEKYLLEKKVLQQDSETQTIYHGPNGVDAKGWDHVLEKGNGSIFKGLRKRELGL